MDKTQEISEIYNDRYRTFELWSGPHHGGYHFGIPNSFFDHFNNSKMIENMSEFIIDQLGVTPETKTILDAGCGAGDIARRIKKRYPQDSLKVFGITLSDKQIELGNKRIQEEHIHNLELSKQSFERTSFADNFFDIVFYTDSLCYGEGAAKSLALQECSRILKPGGTMVIADGFAITDPKTWPKEWQRWDATIREAWGIDSWLVEKDFLSEAARLGFHKTQEIDMTKRLYPSMRLLIAGAFALVALGPLLRLFRLMNKQELAMLRAVAVSFIKNRKNTSCPYKIVTMKKNS